MSTSSPTTPQTPTFPPQASLSIPLEPASRPARQVSNLDTQRTIPSQHDAAATTPPTALLATTPSTAASAIAAAPRPPIHLHVRRSQPALAPLLTRLQHPLAALRPLPYGPPHPSFPATLLAYHLLTEAQLDSLAGYYHQRARPGSPSRMWMGAYPASMRWDDGFLGWVGERRGGAARVGVKRRKVGRFIGLRGCETPRAEAEEEERWREERARRGIKGDEGAFWGRKGWGL